MRQICLALPNYTSRVPDSSFILSDTNEPKDGSRAGDKLIQGMRGDGWAMVHLPHGGTINLNLTKALPVGTNEGWKAWWIDPRTGGRECFQTSKEPASQVSFTAPAAHGEDSDWLLFVETVSGSKSWFSRAI